MSHSIGHKISAARKKAGMTLDDLGAKIGMSRTNISVIENDGLKNGPDSQTLIRISEALNAPEILIHHCESCPVRQHIMLKLFPDLNNIRRDPAIIAARLRKEMIEGAEALENLSERFSDVNFRTRPDFQDQFESLMEQVVDVKRGVEILEFELILSRVCSRDDLDRVYERQQAKCEQHGHHLVEERKAA